MPSTTTKIDCSAKLGPRHACIIWTLVVLLAVLVVARPLLLRLPSIMLLLPQRNPQRSARHLCQSSVSEARTGKQSAAQVLLLHRYTVLNAILLSYTCTCCCCWYWKGRLRPQTVFAALPPGSVSTGRRIDCCCCFVIQRQIQYVPSVSEDRPLASYSRQA